MQIVGRALLIDGGVALRIEYSEILSFLEIFFLCPSIVIVTGSEIIDLEKRSIMSTMEPRSHKSSSSEFRQRISEKVMRRRSLYDHYTTVVMRRFSNPFGKPARHSSYESREKPRVKVHDASAIVPGVASPLSKSGGSSSSLGLPLQKPGADISAEAFSAELCHELEQIQTHVEITSARLHHLQDLLEKEEPAVIRVTEIKRQLKSTHRDVEKLQFDIQADHGDSTALPVKDVVRGVWQAYRQMVKLEEKLRGGRSRASSMEVLSREVTKGDESDVKPKQVVESQTSVYIPTGARDVKRDQTTKTKSITSDKENKAVVMTGTFPATDDVLRDIRRASSEALRVLTALPKLITSGPGMQANDDTGENGSPRRFHDERQRYSNGSGFEEAHPEQWPQPRSEVISRLRREEVNLSLSLRQPDTIRRGSCNGYTITEMVLGGIEDYRFVVPYLHHIKHHEVRVLRQWLSEHGHVRSSGLMSCTEKLLHCIQLLQTGNRYETIAVLFSRSPRQIRDSCHEVMEGLLELYNATVDGDSEHEVYAPLWLICKKFVLNAQKAEDYYGFRWMGVVQVLVALNLYIGRSRGSPSPFEGTPFRWGKFLVPARSVQLRHTSDRVREIENSSDESSQDGESSSSDSDYDSPVVQIITR